MLLAWLYCSVGEEGKIAGGADSGKGLPDIITHTKYWPIPISLSDTRREVL